MAVGKPGPLTERSIPRSRGRFYGRVFRDGIVFQKWPRKRPKAKTGGEYYKQREFGMAAAWASDPEPIGYQTAVELSKGTTNVPRDLIMMTSYGTFYRVFLPDGTEASYYRMVAPNAQFILDQITDQVGSLIYRAEIGWVQVSPGNSGQVLAIIDLQPQWQDVYPVAIAGAPFIVAVPDPSIPNAISLESSDSVIADYATDGQVAMVRAEITGDVSIPEDENVATIPNGTVTYPKLQNVTASQRLLGRNTSGAGVVEELDAATVSSMLGGGAGAGIASPYWSTSTIYLCQAVVGGSSLTTLALAANRICFIPFAVPALRTFTSIAINVNTGGGVGSSNARLGLYTVDPTSGGPGSVVLDAGNVTTATAGLRAIAISQAINPGRYYFALWSSAAITVRALSGSFADANNGYDMGAGTPASIGYLIRNATFGTAFADESAQAHTLQLGTLAQPLVGIR